MRHTHDARELRRLLTRTEQALADLEAQNATGGDAPPPRLPQELANAQALRQRVEDALARVEAEGGPRHTNLTDQDAALLKTATAASSPATTARRWSPRWRPRTKAQGAG